MIKLILDIDAELANLNMAELPHASAPHVAEAEVPPPRASASTPRASAPTPPAVSQAPADGKYT